MKNLTKKIAYATAALAIGFGTFYRNAGVPLLVNGHERNNAGIALGCANANETNITFNGVYAGLININAGTLNGLNIGFSSVNYGTLNGASIGVVSPGVESNMTERITRGLELNLVMNNLPADENFPSTIYGVQASLLGNTARAGSRGLQIGIWNRIQDNEGNIISSGPFLHIMNGYKPKSNSTNQTSEVKN